MKLFVFFVIFTAGLLLPALGTAGGFDGTGPITCAIVEIYETGPGSQPVVQGTAKSFNFPDFIQLDFKTKQLIGKSKAQKTLTSPIATRDVQDGKLILHGSQQGRAWNMVISQGSGHMTATVAADEFAFTIFGACLPR